MGLFMLLMFFPAGTSVEGGSKSELREFKKMFKYKSKLQAQQTKLMKTNLRQQMAQMKDYVFKVLFVK